MANVGQDWEHPDCVHPSSPGQVLPWDRSPHIPEKSLVHGVDVNSLVSSPAFPRSNGRPGLL